MRPSQGDEFGLKKFHVRAFSLTGEKRGIVMEQWIEEELECFQGGDARIHRRAKQILAGQYANPTRTFYASAGSSAAAKATYRFQKNPSVKEQALLESHVQKVKQRMADHPVVLCINDTTQLNFATQSAKENRGTLSTSPHPNGYLLHPLVAFTPNKTCLGVLGYQIWSRSSKDFLPHPIDLRCPSRISSL